MMHQVKNDDVEEILMEKIRQRSESFFYSSKKIPWGITFGKKTCYSNGKFNRFKQRHGIKLLKISGEKATAGIECAKDYVMELMKKEKVSLEDI